MAHGFSSSTALPVDQKVGIEHRESLVSNYADGKALLIVNVRLTNSSDVLWRWDQSVVTLFDARRVSDSGHPRLVPFAQADPFLPVYGVTSEDAASIAAGNTFHYYAGQEIMLEPGEQVESEIALVLDADKLGLMALKIWFSGYQRKRSRKPYEWAIFGYVDPGALSAVRNQS